MPSSSSLPISRHHHLILLVNQEREIRHITLPQPTSFQPSTHSYSRQLKKKRKKETKTKCEKDQARHILQSPKPPDIPKRINAASTTSGSCSVVTNAVEWPLAPEPAFLSTLELAWPLARQPTDRSTLELLVRPVLL